jgi:acyl carrier protein
MSSETVNARVRAIEKWLVSRVAAALGVPPERIDAREDLSRYALGSIEAMAVVGDLEDWLGLVLDPTVLWDHPTIAALAFHLARDAGAGAERPGA